MIFGQKRLAKKDFEMIVALFYFGVFVGMSAIIVGIIIGSYRIKKYFRKVDKSEGTSVFSDYNELFSADIQYNIEYPEDFLSPEKSRSYIDKNISEKEVKARLLVEQSIKDVLIYIRSNRSKMIVPHIDSYSNILFAPGVDINIFNLSEKTFLRNKVIELLKNYLIDKVDNLRFREVATYSFDVSFDVRIASKKEEK